jgi:hypothetical protein
MLSRRSSRHAGFALSVLALGACDLVDSPQVFCTDNFVYGLVVAVQDSLTGAPTASGAQLIARDGAYADTMAFPPNRPDLDDRTLTGAGERPGTYTATVSKAGFLDWVRSGIVVTEDQYGCHVQPVSLTARLQRAP